MVKITWEEFGLVRTLSGTISVPEMDASALEIQGNPRLDDMRYNIHDFSAVTEALLPRADIEFMAVRASFSIQRNPRLKLAFVGTHPIVHTLMDAFHTLGCAPNRIIRFDTLDAAYAYCLA